MEPYFDNVVDDLAERYGETVARIYCLTMAYQKMSIVKPILLLNEELEIARWYLDKANTFRNCDYVFGVMDLRHDIKEKLKDDSR